MSVASPNKNTEPNLYYDRSITYLNHSKSSNLGSHGNTYIYMHNRYYLRFVITNLLQLWQKIGTELNVTYNY